MISILQILSQFCITMVLVFFITLLVAATVGVATFGIVAIRYLWKASQEAEAKPDPEEIDFDYAAEDD